MEVHLALACIARNVFLAPICASQVACKLFDMTAMRKQLRSINIRVHEAVFFMEQPMLMVVARHTIRL